jgi:hypothetical protein
VQLVAEIVPELVFVNTALTIVAVVAVKFVELIKPVTNKS